MIHYRKIFQDEAKAACGELNECVILNWPDYANPGDHFIALGVFNFLVNILNVRVNHIASMRTINMNDVKATRNIVFVGGGCFGDLYPWNIDGWCDLLSNIRGKRIYIFPVTSHFIESERLKRAKDLFARFGKDLVLMLRDKLSLDFCEIYFKHNKLALVPDAAFELARMAEDLKNYRLGGSVFLSRGKDVEAKDREDNPVYKEYDFKNKLKHWDNKPWLIWEKIKKHCKWNYYYPMLSYSVFQDAVREFSKYDYLHTDRLHGHILAEMMQIRHEVWNDKFNKILDFHGTWTFDSQWVAEVHP